MKIRPVFIGDFSGLSLFLSRGVQACGVDTVLYSNGDGWKGIPRSNQLFEGANNWLHRGWNQLQGARSLCESLSKNDTLVLSTEFLFNRWIDARLLGDLIKKVGRTVLLHAGCSDGFHRLHADELLCRNCKKYDLNSEQCVFDHARWPGLASTLNRVDLIVPFTNFYTESAQMFGVPASHVTVPLHFPIDFNYVHGLVREQGLVREHSSRHGTIHGQNRPGFKGTAHLRQMMIAHPPLQPLIELLPRMPFVDFIGRLGAAEIILDQLFANGYGMTGALALATGTSVAFGHTGSQPKGGFDGPGCVPVSIKGDTLADALALEQALSDHLQNPPDRNAVVQAARLRHDHSHVATAFLQLLS
jgi:hypothetical protein